MVEEGRFRWTSAELGLLRQHAKNLESTHSPDAAAIRAVIVSIEWSHWIPRIELAWLLHATFWVTLIFFYPRSPQIQAIFFWNPWVRKFLGLGYVNFALTWIPSLRDRLLAPFRQSLIAEAFPEQLAIDEYFAEMEVIDAFTGKQQNISSAIPDVRGHIVLEGESGLGKTMFLRSLVASSRRTIAFLLAEQCQPGVFEAIQQRLEGQAADFVYLRNIIWSGGLSVVIDGLNNASADTRANIAEFVRKYTKTHILVTTQPLEWKAPATAKVYRLLPLNDVKIQVFLLSRHQLPEYAQRCSTFLRNALRPDQNSDDLTIARMILSNPMDLSTVSELLAARETDPNLFRLQDHQYRVMGKTYRDVNGREFPLRQFSEHAYQVRLCESSLLDGKTFAHEMAAMEIHKMVLSREDAVTKNRFWYFRHEKIWEFFIVQTFLGSANERVSKHLDDPRFRGVYLLLALLLPVDAAQDLREILILRSVETKDHTVSDSFIQILKSRRAQIGRGESQTA